MRRVIVAGNWKMHGSRQFVSDYVRDLVTADENVDGPPGWQSTKRLSVVLFPPSAYLDRLQRHLNEAGISGVVATGGQDLHPQPEGAHTGCNAGEMLRDLGASWVLVGHSERRQTGETDEMVAAKYAAALRAGLTPVLCIGESERQRDEGRAEVVVAGQIACVAAEVGATGLRQGVIAYEPVWAIGTGKTATPEIAQAMHARIRGELEQLEAGLGDVVSVLYGGSVKAANAAQLFGQPDIDGGLVGGASLDATELMRIAAAAI